MSRSSSMVLLVVVLAAIQAHAATAHFSRLSVEDGLSQSSVEIIAEDRYGFLWFGTQEGLNRFDGYEFEVHQTNPHAGQLHDGFIRAIETDGRGDLWVGTTTGLQHLDVASGRFTESISPPGVGVRLNTLRIAGDGHVWFADNDGKLWSRAATSGPAQRVPIDIPALEITAVELGAKGEVWFATDGQLFSLIGSSAKSVLPAVGAIRVMHFDGKFLWLGRIEGPPMRFDPQSGAVTEYPDLPPFVLSIASAGEGRLWFGAKHAGLTRFDPTTREMLTYRNEPGNEESLASDNVAAIHQDRGGNLWIGAWNGGVSRLNLFSQALRTLRNTPGQADSLPDNDVTRMAEGPDGRLWTITRNEVLAVGDPKSGSFVPIPHGGSLTSIAFADSRLFAGTTTGLIELDPASGRTLEPSAVIRSSGLAQIRIETIAGADDCLWVVAAGMVFRLTPGEGTIAGASLPLSNQPTAVHATSKTRLWISYAAGLLVRADFANGAVTLRPNNDVSLAGRGRLDAVIEDHGVVWVGSSLGVGRLNPNGGPVQWMDLQRGMPSRSVASILADDAGVLWIATERGITRFDPRSGHAVHFGAAQGAQGSGYVESGAARGHSGLMYLSGKGITVFDPQRVSVNPHPPRVVFSTLEILHHAVVPQWMDPQSPLATGIHAANEVTLGPDAVVFSVQMAAPDASDPDGIQFAHRLDGFEHDWIETNADRRLATYTRLEPGSYLLRARARTQSGQWSANEATLRIRILPPWWRTRAAMALWIAASILAIFIVAAEIRRRTRVRIALAEQEVLRRASFTDPLSGLYNRRFLAEWLKQEIPRILRTHRRAADSDSEPESLLFVVADLDNLKKINDTYGHDAGDRAICAIADVLRAHARSDDLTVRFGGDEFVLVLRSKDREHAHEAVKRLRAAADHLDLGLDASTRPTVSLGFAYFPFLENDIEALTWQQTIQLADHALLYSKERSRNRWTGFVATPMTSSAALLAQLSVAADHAPPPSVRVVEGPDGSTHIR